MWYYVVCFKCVDCGVWCVIVMFVKIGEEVYCWRYALECDVW